MITEIPRQMGRTPARLIDYLASPRRDHASVLDTNLLGGELRGWAEQIETVARSGKSRGGRFVKHMILAFAPEDPVSKLDLRELVRFYLDKMGYGEAPFLAVLHQDTDHSHVHIVTTPRTWQGAAVSQSWEHLRSVEVAREIERRYGLRPVALPKDSPRRQADQAEVKRGERWQEKPARQRFQEDIAEAALRSQSFDELVHRAERLGYEVRALLDDNGELSGLSFGKDGLAFSGAQLGRDFRGTRFLRAFSLSQTPSEVPMAEPLPLDPDPSAQPQPEGKHDPTAGTGADLSLERQRLEEKLQELAPLAGNERASTETLERAARGRPELPEAGEASRLQERVDLARQSPGPPQEALAAASDRDLFTEATRATLAHLQVPDAARPAHEERLLALEEEIGRRGAAAFAALEAADRRLGQTASQLEAAAAHAQAPGAGLEGVRHHRQAVEAHLEAIADFNGHVREHARWLYVEADLDRQRFGLAFEVRQDEATLEALGEATGRALRLEHQASPELLHFVVHPQPRAMLQDDLADAEAYLATARAQLGHLSPTEVEIVKLGVGQRELARFALELTPDSPALAQEGPGRAATPQPGEAVARPLAPEPDLSPKPLPEGKYHLSAVDPARIADPRGHLAPNQLAWVRSGWDLSQIEKASQWLRHENERRAILIRPRPGAESRLGFRGVTAEQVTALKEAGLEPEWVVRAGARFDVIVRLPERLLESEEHRLRQELIQRFGLPAYTGYQMDAVHLPGSQVEPRGPRAELVELRAEPASQGREWVADLREGVERSKVLERAQQVRISPEEERAPALALAEASRERPRFPEAGFVSSLQQRVERARSKPGEPDPKLKERSDRGLIEEARRLNRELGQVSGGQIAEHDGRLLALEGEIRHRGASAFDALQAAEGKKDEAARAVEATLARSQAPGAGVEELRAHRQALAAYAPIEADHSEKAHAYARWLWVEASLDRQRFALAFTTQPDTQTLDALGEAIGRELRLERLTGGNPTSELAPQATRPELEQNLAGIERHLAGVRGQLKSVPEAELATVQTALRERELARLVLGREGLVPEPKSRPALEKAVEGTNGQETVNAFFDYRKELAERSAAEALGGQVAATASERLPQAAQQVARGDVSPEALRQLNGSLVALDGAGAVRVPDRNAPGEPREWVARLLALERDIRRDAGWVAAQGGEGSAEVRQRLLAASSEAVGLHQRLEHLQRVLLQIADPGKAPEGVSAAAWRTAWLLQAIDKGLSPELAASQLGNLANAPSLASSFVPGGKAAGAALMAGRFAAGVANRWVERVLRH